MRRGPAGVLPGLLLGLLLGTGAALVLGCGGEPARPPAAAQSAGWQHATLGDLGVPTAATILGERLLVVCDGDRRVHDVALGALVPADGAAGGRVPVRSLSLEPTRLNHLEGHEDGPRGTGLSGQGYRLGDLWDQPLTFRGFAARHVPSLGAAPAVDRVWLLERQYGIVWWGRLVLGRDGEAVAVMLTNAFTVPGRPRAGRESLDWRDSGPGLGALAPAGKVSPDEDLVALDAAATEKEPLRLQLLDRFGMRLGRWPVDLVTPGAEVRALAFDGTQHLVLLGPGRGELRPMPGAPTAMRLAPETGEATPVVEGVATWSTAAAAPGRLVLLGADAQGRCVAAWRRTP
jgi:hypothetical protein